ncbi:hypothetical protein E2C01_035727 [Portunus trituberculatus]|uniref:Uncharacterized protein n=1 Tax=Portunus trituberculatus TaxID=210409 RepID=A0A5B7FAI1_PORTR|nr:hypothetical protein [Portunus trituberculatus]
MRSLKHYLNLITPIHSTPDVLSENIPHSQQYKLSDMSAMTKEQHKPELTFLLQDLPTEKQKRHIKEHLF